MHWFLDPIQNHYVDFQGRATRQEYWMFLLFSVLVGIAVGIVDGMLGTMFLVGLFQLAILLPSIAIGVRRLHDLNKSGWWLLLSFVPLIGGLILLVWFIGKSVDEGNQYGPGSGAPAGAAVAVPPADSTAPTPPVDGASQQTETPVEENKQEGFGN